jgi:hypothetical protein
VILVAFKAIDSVLSGQDGGFDSHTLPPYLLEKFHESRYRTAHFREVEESYERNVV